MPQENEVKLLPCRFCNEYFQLQVIRVDFKNPSRDIIKCRGCGSQAKREFWQQRSTPFVMSEEIGENCTEGRNLKVIICTKNKTKEFIVDGNGELEEIKDKMK